MLKSEKRSDRLLWQAILADGIIVMLIICGYLIKMSRLISGIVLCFSVRNVLNQVMGCKTGDKTQCQVAD